MLEKCQLIVKMLEQREEIEQIHTGLIKMQGTLQKDTNTPKISKIKFESDYHSPFIVIGNAHMNIIKMMLVDYAIELTKTQLNEINSDLQDIEKLLSQDAPKTAKAFTPMGVVSETMPMGINMGKSDRTTQIDTVTMTNKQAMEKLNQFIESRINQTNENNIKRRHS